MMKSIMRWSNVKEKSSVFIRIGIYTHELIENSDVLTCWTNHGSVLQNRHNLKKNLSNSEAVLRKFTLYSLK